MGNKQPDKIPKIYLKETKTIQNDDIDSIIALNNKYIIYKISGKVIKIEEIETNIFSYIKYDSVDLLVIFHPRIENIFLFADANIIIIYEIIKDNNNILCQAKTSLDWSSLPILKAIFSNTDDRIFAFFTRENTIKIYDVEEVFCICNILVNNNINIEMKIYNNFIFYYDETKNFIIKYNYRKFEIVDQFECGIKKFIIINENELCLFNLYSMSIRKNNNEINIFNFPYKFNDCFYDENIKLLYIFYVNYLEIFKIENMVSLLKIKRYGEFKVAFSNILNEVNVCANFIFFFRDRLEIHSVIHENNYKLKIEIESKKNSSKKSITWIPKISNIENLKWDANEYDNEKIIFKKYLNIKEIKKELNDNYNKSLDEKKLEVENVIKSIKESKKIELNYIEILKLLIKDNTNINLIIIYLKYLKDNMNKIILENNDNIENFKDEYNNYKVIFNNNQLMENNFEQKDKSQKDIFIELLNRIKLLEIKDNKNENINNNNNNNNNNINNNNNMNNNNTNNDNMNNNHSNNATNDNMNNNNNYSNNATNDNMNNNNPNNNNMNNNNKLNNNNININNDNNNKNNEIDSFWEYVNKIMESLQLFNQPINLMNEELFWQRNCYVVYYALKNILNDESKISKLQLMKEAINLIQSKGLFEEKYIIKNKNLFSSIILLIVIPQPKNYLEYNLNLIETKKESYNYQNELNKHKFIEIQKKDKTLSHYIIYNKEEYYIKKPSTKCINNFILNIKNVIKIEEFEEGTYERVEKFFDNIINFNEMKKYLSKIFSSNVIKEAFKYLYPSYFKFPFKNQKEALDFLEKYYHFIPLKTMNTAGVTERFSLEIYYILKNRECNTSKTLSNEMNELCKKILYKGAVVKTSCHEINHEFYNIFLMHSNGMIPLQTPRKAYFKEGEGGRNMEMILFDRKIYKLTLIECLYLLNEKNYEKNLQDFRKGFNELNIKDLNFDDDNPFNVFNEILKIDNFLEIAKSTVITCEESEESNFWTDTYIDDIEDVNDVLGFIRDPSKYCNY